MNKFYYFHILVKYGNPTIKDFKKYRDFSNDLVNNNLKINLLPVPVKKAIEYGVLNKEISNKERDLDCFLIDNKYNFMFLKYVSDNIKKTFEENLLLKKYGYSEKEFSCWCRFNQNRCEKCHEEKSDNIGILKEA